MIISNLNYVETTANDVFGAGDSLGILNPLALGVAESSGGRNNIASPALGLGLNLTPFTQLPVL